MGDPHRAVRATYRAQLTPDFGFSEVAELAPYLARLGISHVYCSPYLQAAPGSEHGYDVTIHSRLSEELGGRAGFEKMCAALQEQGLGHIADVVPNHVAAVPQDPAWWDLLRFGPSSAYASWFDIDWEDCDGKVMLGILGDELEDVLARKEIERDGNILRYFDHILPIAPGTEHIDELAELIEAQHYVLAPWRYAVRNLNYRRFFDISELIALDMDQPGVFEATHRLVLELIAEGRLDGLRIDHIDGLRDPQAYLERLREEIGDTYLVVEKILEGDEQIPPGWPVDGTTGYEFMNLVGGIFIDPEAEEHLTRLYRDFTGIDDDPEELIRSRKMLVMRFVLPADLSRHTRTLQRVYEGLGWPEDTDTLRLALAETIAGLHVYRTYISPDGDVSDLDRHRIETAIEQARRRSLLPAETFDRLQRVMLLQEGGDRSLEFVLSLQQFTGPVMAKSLEDTFFYNYNRFVALNEVGGDPLRFGRELEDLWRWDSGGLLATSTHDTKRSEDVRARLFCLSEIPEEWEAFLLDVSQRAEPYRSGEVPDRNTEYLIYQTLVGAWPVDETRLVTYVEKAIREAKRFTSWLDPDPDYETAVLNFARSILTDSGIVSVVEAMVERIIDGGRVNSLAQTLVKLTMPGVPDIYQGCESWDLSLVDPDNRRPVDHAALQKALEMTEGMDARRAWEERDSGLPKVLVTRRALELRRRYAAAFNDPALPLTVTGPAVRNAVCFARRDDAVVIVPRLSLSLDWGDTAVELPQQTYLNVFTREQVRGGRCTIEDLLGGFPVALLSRL